MHDLSLFRPQRAIWTLVIVFALVLLIWPYIEAEYITKVFAKSESSDNVCRQNFADIQLKYSKVIKFERYRGYAKIFCFSYIPAKSVEAEVEWQKGWRVVFSEKLNKARNFYWPMYINQ